MITEGDSDIWQRSITMLDRSDPKQMTMLILILCGTFFALRGNEEHSNLELNNIAFGSYAPGSEFEGMDYVEITDLIDKSHKLSTTNSWKRNTEGSMRIPIISQDVNSPGTILFNYITNKMSPGQLRIHCKPATRKQMEKFRIMNFPEAMYSPDQPLGRNTIREYFQEAGVILKLQKPLNGHALRRLSITKMASGGVCLTEIMATARHSSIAATSAYMQRNHDTGKARLKALGINL